MRFKTLHRRRRAVQHARNQLLVPVRHLRGAVQLQNIARRVIAAERAPAFQRHAGMPPAGQLELDDMRRRFEHRIDVAVALIQNRGFGVAAKGKLGGVVARIELRRQRLDLDRNKIGGILGNIRILGEHRCNRLAYITHLVDRQYRLAIRGEPGDRPFAKIDRRHIGNVGRGPHRHDAGQRARRFGIDRYDVGMGVVGANDPHVKLTRKVDVAGEAAAAGHERRILQPLDRLADPSCRAGLLVHEPIFIGLRSPARG